MPLLQLLQFLKYEIHNNNLPLAAMLGTLFLIIGLYFLYSLIFNFILPIYRASRKMRDQMREFQGKMNTENGYSNHQSAPDNTQRATQTESAKAGDYIDFEEVK